MGLAEKRSYSYLCKVDFKLTIIKKASVGQLLTPLSLVFLLFFIIVMDNQSRTWLVYQGSLTKLSDGAITFDHPGQTSWVSGWRVSMLERHSVIVKANTTLRLDDIVAMIMEKEAVYLEEDATVVLTRSRCIVPCSEVFSVASSSQVIYHCWNINIQRFKEGTLLR